MGLRVLVISIAAPAALAEALRRVRRQHGEAHVTALVGSAKGCEAADEVLVWGSYGGRGLMGEIRSRRADLLVVVHGKDQYLTRAYWKLVALAAVSGARAVSFGGQGDACGPAPAASRAAGRGLLGAAGQAAAEMYVAAMGLLLLPVLIGIIVADVTERVAGAGGAAGRTGGSQR